MGNEEMKAAPGILMLLSLLYSQNLPFLNAQSSGVSLSARLLDALLQDYAFRALVRPKTGVPYEGRVPDNLTGTQVFAVRLRSGSLRTKGFRSYREFQIPTGVFERPYVKRLVLVYQNLGNWSSLYYPLPGFNYLAPVLGLLAYNASNLTATNLPELDIDASDNPILIKFQEVRLNFFDGSSVPKPKCVFFGLHGSVEFENVLSGNVCSTTQQGHFSIVVESAAPSPAPDGGFGGGDGGGGGRTEVWIIVGCLVGGAVVLIVLGLLVVWGKGSKDGKRREGEWGEGENLEIRSIGNTWTPLAMVTRTPPVLEEYAGP